MKLSVSVITYNEEEYVQQAMESVLNQQVDFDYEVVIGDDGSSDATPDILARLQVQATDRIRLLMATLNAGDHGLTNLTRTLRACSGQYVALLDGDDYWSSPHKLQRQVDFLDAHPECAICCHPIIRLSRDGRELPVHRKKGGIYSARDLLLRNFVPKISAVYRRAYLDDLPPWFAEDSLGPMDWVLHVLMARHGEIGYLDAVMAVHRDRQDSVSERFGLRGLLRGRLRAYRLLRPYFPGHQAVIARAMLHTRLKLAITYLGPLPLEIRNVLRWHLAGRTASLPRN